MTPEDDTTDKPKRRRRVLRRKDAEAPGSEVDPQASGAGDSAEQVEPPATEAPPAPRAEEADEEPAVAAEPEATEAPEPAAAEAAPAAAAAESGWVDAPAEPDAPTEFKVPAATEEAAATEEDAPTDEAAAPKPARGLRRGRRAATEPPPAPKPAPRRAKRDPNLPAPVVRAYARNVHSSPRKARLVCDHIRGKSVEEARAILMHTTRGVARDWSKLLESAVANAEHNHELVGEDLYIKVVKADDGPTLKRYRPRAMGRATKIRKRTSHLTILLTPKE
jgi:ribosomal protein L22